MNEDDLALAMHYADQGDALLADLRARARRDLDATLRGEPISEMGIDIGDLMSTTPKPVLVMALLRASFELVSKAPVL